MCYRCVVDGLADKEEKRIMLNGVNRQREGGSKGESKGETKLSEEEIKRITTFYPEDVETTSAVLESRWYDDDEEEIEKEDSTHPVPSIALPLVEQSMDHVLQKMLDTMTWQMNYQMNYPSSNT